MVAALAALEARLLEEASRWPGRPSPIWPPAWRPMPRPAGSCASPLPSPMSPSGSGWWGRWSFGVLAGTKEGMVRVLQRLGYEAEVREGPFPTWFDGNWLFGDYEGAFSGEAWAEFVVRLRPQGAFRQPERAYILRLIRELKPAHAVLRSLEVVDAHPLRTQLLPRADTILSDFGTWGDFLFGEVRPGYLAVSLYAEGVADGRTLTWPAFGGWEFGDW